MKSSSILILAILMLVQTSFAQTVNDYLDAIDKEYKAVSEATWNYTRTSAHSSSFRKIESQRKKLLKTTKDAADRIKGMTAWNGNTSYRDSIVRYFEISYDVINNDYAKLMDLEDVKEQSYDAMEAYMLAEQIANDKLDSANQVVVREQKKFCADNNINLIEDESDLGKKMRKAGEVYGYYNEIYLIFFKANVQEMYLMNAINSKDVGAMEQIKNSLKQFAAEGLEKMKSKSAFKSDNSVVNATNKILTFYLEEATNDVQTYIDYFMEADKFEKLTKAIEAKKNRTQKDVDEYNAALKKFQTLTDKFNAVNQKLNNERSQLVEKWNSTTAAFIDRHVPK